MECPSCGEAAPDDAAWCEACGADLSAVPAEPCVSCGEREVGDDGYCMACGHKQPAPRDHYELVEGPVAAASDRGRRHHHNEDAVAIGAVPAGPVVLVVCDGVSSTPGSDEASAAASSAARDLLLERLTADPEGPAPDLLVEAVVVAQEQAAAAPEVEPTGPFATGGPPSSTLGAAVAQPGPEPQTTRVTVAWVGDSRAYWIGADQALLLTEDHEISGSLIRWLGADSVEPVPDLAHLDADGPGVLVVCSDGLWRYAEEPEAMAALVGRLRAGGSDGEGANDLPALAAGLVAHALEGGGHDNITVAVWATAPVADPAVV